MIERILELMRSKKMNAAQFADELGIQRSGMSHLVSGRNKPSLEFVMKVLTRFPEVPADYLLFGRKTDIGERDNPSIPENPVANVVADTAVQHDLFSMTDKEPAETLLESPVKPVKKGKNEKRTEKILFCYSDKTFREYDPE